jgi:hypothetical protein
MCVNPQCRRLPEHHEHVMPPTNRIATRKKIATRAQEPNQQQAQGKSPPAKDGLSGQGADSALVQLRAQEKKRVPRRDNTE